jgi:hypothetical protein
MNKSILTALVAALVVGSASAQTIHIGGSTAFGSVSMTSITNVPGVTLLASDNADLAKSKIANFRWVDGAVTNLVKVALQGSENGIQSVAGPTNIASGGKVVAGFYGDTADRNVGGGTSTGTIESRVAQFCFSDTWQGSSLFVGRRAGDGVNYTSCGNATSVTGTANSGDSIVGVVAFTFAGSKGITAAGVTNITTENAKSLYGGVGAVQVSSLNGTNTDTNSIIYALGRDRASGTRLIALASIGIGAQGTQYIKKYVASNNLVDFPAGTYNNLYHDLGNGGETSGSTLAGQLANTLAANNLITGGLAGFTGNAYMIAYCGLADAKAAAASGVVELSYNGVPATVQNIRTGRYPFWSYQHMIINPAYSSTAAGTPRKFYNLLRTAILTKNAADAAPNVILSDMLVKRSADGGQISSRQY